MSARVSVSDQSNDLILRFFPPLHHKPEESTWVLSTSPTEIATCSHGLEQALVDDCGTKAFVVPNDCACK